MCQVPPRQDPIIDNESIPTLLYFFNNLSSFIINRRDSLQLLQQFSIFDQMNSQSLTLPISENKPCRSLLLIRRKKFKNIRQCHSKKGNQKLGMWNLAETVKYITFVRNNLQKFSSEESRRLSRVFCLMAKEVRTRSSVQCRSHHQKMIQTYGEVDQLINHYQTNVIPYYQAKACPPEPKSNETIPVENFYVFKQVGNVLRIQIKQSWIASY